MCRPSRTLPTLRACALALAALALPATSRSASAASDADVESALVAAGPHRAELETVLAHFERAPDARGLDAARFLLAHMPGKGYAVMRLHDAKGVTVPFDALAHDSFAAAQRTWDALEKTHGPLDFDRERTVLDVETIPAAFLIAHVEASLRALDATPRARRPGFAAFLEYVLPYRGSEEPVEDWFGVLRARFEKAPGSPLLEPDAAAVWRFASAEASHALRFDERYYLHPTDQGFAEMERSKTGRCEDITNRTTYAARALGLVTAADYTPAWGHRDNNHAWPVLLDAEGRGSAGDGARAAKVYRKTWSRRPDALASSLPAGRVPPNRWLANPSQIDVTDQYGPTTDVSVRLTTDAARAEAFAYLCVFNGGEWVAIASARIEGGNVTFPKAGRGVVYLPATHDGTKLVPAAPPRIALASGDVEVLDGEGAPQALVLTATTPEQTSVDTRVTTPVSALEPGRGYDLFAWEDGWSRTAGTASAGAAGLPVEGLSARRLYWLVAKDSRRLERPFTIEAGRQRFW